jgi:hypothetical protein
MENKNPVKRRRGRPRKNEIIIKKPKEKKKIIQQNSEEILLHLPIKFSELTENNSEKKLNNSFSLNDITEDKDINNTVQDYNKLNELKKNLLKKDKIIKTLKDELKKKNILKTPSDKKISKMNIDFIKDINGKQVLVSKTDICCWWCTDEFNTLPCFIPIKYHDNNFHVFGCFCSYSCAASYNIKMNDYKLWERHTLLKKLYNKIYNNTSDIILAPARETLKKFGGILDINEFRKNNNSIDKNYNVILPPLTSIIPYIEEKTNYKFNDNKINKIKMKYMETNTKKNKKTNDFDLIESMGLKSKFVK